MLETSQFKGPRSRQIGFYNDVNTVGEEAPRHAAAIGFMNFVVGNSSLAAGTGNNLEADNAAALGHGLTTTADASTVVGTSDMHRTGLRFVVGNGTGPTAAERANAFDVYANGDIIMKKQGDISMGAFDAIP